jgi:hypothetical protein
VEQAVGLSHYAQEDEGEMEMIRNSSQYAEQGGEGEDEGRQESCCIADEGGLKRLSVCRARRGRGTQELIATYDIAEATSQQLDEFRRATIGGGPSSNKMANCTYKKTVNG